MKDFSDKEIAEMKAAITQSLLAQGLCLDCGEGPTDEDAIEALLMEAE